MTLILCPGLYCTLSGVQREHGDLIFFIHIYGLSYTTIMQGMISDMDMCMNVHEAVISTRVDDLKGVLDSSEISCEWLEYVGKSCVEK